jgi:hypothetical protein
LIYSVNASPNSSDELNNACDSIRFNPEFDLNEIDESDSQSEKQNDPRISTFREISIDRSDEYENADDSVRFNGEFDSNEIDESDLQYEKHGDPWISTFRDISIDLTARAAWSKDTNELIDE